MWLRLIKYVGSVNASPRGDAICGIKVKEHKPSTLLPANRPGGTKAV